MSPRILLALGAALLSTTAALAQTSATASGVTATTNIYVPISITKTANLTFGDVFPGPVAGTVTVDPSGAATTFTGTGVSLGVHAASYATFSMGGKNSAAFTLTLPADGTVSMTGPGPAIPLSSFTASVGGGATTLGPTIAGQALNASGIQTVAVGAKMSIAAAATQTQGSYSGTFNVTVNYQ